MTQRFRKLSHSLYECKYHIIFCPKYRFRVLRGELADYIRREIYSLLGQKEGVEVLEANVQADHIHLVMWIPPKYAVSNIMGFLKGKLAIRVFNRYEQLRKRYYNKQLWARGYCVSTVGIDEEKVRLYVQWQEKLEKHDEAQQKRLFD
jgi:putative transposase